MPRIFIAQSLVDGWISGGKAQLDRDILRVGGGGGTFDLFINPAVYFDRIDGSESDDAGVIGKVKTSQELAQMDAEHYETSVVLGDAAYTVVPGILAVAVDPQGAEITLDGATWGHLCGALEALPT
ncbi:MAG: hypothetical protein KC420_17210 [Myxococcales bacterium]|nr:hypothetical protein [Myxococcales bacterium]MCB9566241.1 hypothetical protein [Myxococcales bacterium]MCB9702701.1 hypothetical protein [Myxococcales bacterium]